MSQSNPDSINQATFIKAAPEKVFDTLVSAADWNSFFTTGMELEPVSGGKFIWRWKDWGPDRYTIEVDGRVLEVDRPHRFVFEWGNKRRTTIEINLTAEHGGTTVRLKEFGYGDSKDDRSMMLECAAGWGEALTLLKFYIEHDIVYTAPDRDRGDA